MKLIVQDNKPGSLKQALEVGYILLGPRKDPIRNPEVFPMRKNIHALDQQAIMTVAAMLSPKVVMDKLLKR